MKLLTNPIAGVLARTYSRNMSDSVHAKDRPELRGQARALLRLGVPIVVSQLAQMAIVTTDTVMIGWYDVPSLAAPLFDSVEIIEQHHDGKVDAPSGTGVATAQSMRAARDSDFKRKDAERHNIEGYDSRGAELGGASLHSVRLPGLVAHQVIIFGGNDETLTIRHDSMSRASFIPEILRAVRAAPDLDHLVIGLDRLLGLRTD